MWATLLTERRAKATDSKQCGEDGCRMGPPVVSVGTEPSGRRCCVGNVVGVVMNVMKFDTALIQKTKTKYHLHGLAI
jgi:hypothetical protein